MTQEPSRNPRDVVRRELKSMMILWAVAAVVGWLIGNGCVSETKAETKATSGAVQPR